ncbi:ATP-binding protein [Brevibacterium linens]|uniref:ATP-binding protein n=1 Tax=Brevibacterium linens TaxID=1703 RepID=UPI001C60A645|nr:ATP-binding protein [Brevibacterium linens]
MPLLGPPGVDKTHLGVGLGIKPCHPGYPFAFDTATGWADRLAAAHNSGAGVEWELKPLSVTRMAGSSRVTSMSASTRVAPLAQRSESVSASSTIR